MALPTDLQTQLLLQLPARQFEEFVLPAAVWLRLLHLRFPIIKRMYDWTQPIIIEAKNIYLKAATLAGQAAYSNTIYAVEAIINNIREPAALPILSDIICRGNFYEAGLLFYTAILATNHVAFAWLLAFVDPSYFSDEVFTRMLIAQQTKREFASSQSQESNLSVQNQPLIAPAVLRLNNINMTETGFTISHLLDGYTAETNESNNLYYTVGYILGHPEAAMQNSQVYETALAYLNMPLPAELNHGTSNNMDALLNIASNHFREPTTVFPDINLDMVRIFDPITMQQRATAARPKIATLYPTSRERDEYLALLDFIINPTHDYQDAEHDLPTLVLLLFGRADLINVKFNFGNLRIRYDWEIVLLYTVDFPGLLAHLIERTTRFDSLIRTIAIFRGYGALLPAQPGLLEQFHAGELLAKIHSSFLLQYVFNDLTDVHIVEGTLHFVYRNKRYIHRPKNSYVANTWRAFGLDFGAGQSDDVLQARLARLRAMLAVI